MLNKSEVADILGEERTYDGVKGFVVADVERGISIKDPEDEESDKYLYCFDYKSAVQEDGEDEADKMFRSRLQVIRDNAALSREIFQEFAYKCSFSYSDWPCPLE
jgi:hypothetical protein